MLRRACLLALTATAGCVLLPTLGGAPPGDGGDGDGVAPVGSGLRDVRGLAHCHSKLSHDSIGEFDAIAEAAAEVGCEFVILTDHVSAPAEDDGPDGPLGGVLFIPGFEARARGGGSLLALGARAGIDPRGAEADVAARVVARGGVIGVGHAEERYDPPAPWAGACELINLHAEITEAGKLSVALRALVLPPGALFRSISHRLDGAAHVYDLNARAHPLAAVGACDAHEAVRLLGPLGGAVDSYHRVMRMATTHVLVDVARPRAALTKAAVLDALRRGRSYAACELDRAATGFRVQARVQGEVQAGEVVGQLGDEVALRPGLVIDVQAPARAELIVLREGSPVARALDDARLTYAVRAPGEYRVEAHLDGKPWVATSAIRVR